MSKGSVEERRERMREILDRKLSQIRVVNPPYHVGSPVHPEQAITAIGRAF